jgi:hypothetical protein
LARQSTFLEELMAGGRGMLGLLIGDKQSGSYFDFSRRGLYGSFIAFLAVTALNALVPTMLGQGDPGGIGRSIAMVAILFVLQVAFSAIVLRQINRLDGLVPYLVADNWATFFVTAASSIVGIFGPAGDFGLVVAALLVLVIEINIARLIVTLSRWQIAMFLVAQVVGVLIGLMVIGSIFPLPPELLTPPS